MAFLLAASAVITTAAQTKTVPRQDFKAVAAKADTARESNRTEDALTLYRQALGLRPDWAEGWWYLGTLLYDRDAYREAARAFQKAAALKPRSGDAAAMLGLSEAKLGRDREALRQLKSARMLGIGEDADLRRVVLFTSGTLHLAAGEFGRAQEELDLLARRGVEEEELILALGQSVLGVLPQALAAADSNARAIIRRAGVAEYFAARSEIAEAQREYSGLAADAPGFHNVQFALGRFLVATHQDEAAVGAFRREIENTPDHLLARLGIAGILAVTNPAAGLPYAEEAIRLNPKLGEAHYLAGLSLLGIGQTKRSIVELETAQRLEPGEAKTYFALSRAYALVQRKEDAARARATFARLSVTTSAPPGGEEKR